MSDGAKKSVAIATEADFDAAMERARAEIDAIVAYLHGDGLFDAETVEGVRQWAEYIVARAEDREARTPRSIEEIRAEARQRQVAAGPQREPRLASAPPGIEIDKDADRVRLVFEVSLPQFWALEAAGRDEAKRNNVEVVGPGHYFGEPWSDELCARWAIQHAISATYPQIAEAPRIGEEALA